MKNYKVSVCNSEGKSSVVIDSKLVVLHSRFKWLMVQLEVVLEKKTMYLDLDGCKIACS